eukprot:3352789-Rhodomonas_salina.3
MLLYHNVSGTIPVWTKGQQARAHQYGRKSTEEVAGSATYTRARGLHAAVRLRVTEIKHLQQTRLNLDNFEPVTGRLSQKTPSPLCAGATPDPTSPS